MSKTNKIILWLVAIIIIAGLIWLGYSERGVVEEGAIKIGVIAPLSGKLSFWGENVKNSLILLSEELNQNKKQVELIFEDSRGIAKDGVSAVNKLINIDNVKYIIGDVVSSVTLSVAPIVEEKKVILLTPASQSSDIKNAGDHIFRIALPNDLASEELSKKILELGYNKISILYSLNDLGKDYQENLVKYFEENGGEILLKEGYNLNESDFSTYLLKIKESNPDALVMFINMEGFLIAKKMSELNMNISLFGGPTWNSKPNTEGVESILEGLIYPLNKLDREDEKYISFIEKYENKFGKKPAVDWMAINTYDSLNVLWESISKYGNDVEKVKEGLYKNKFKGINGIIEFDENGDSFNELQLMIIQNKEKVPYQK